MKNYLFIFIFFCLLGCGGQLPKTATELKQNSKTIIKTINSNKRYQAVYEALFTQMRDCWQGGSYLCRCTISGTIYSDLKKAEITLSEPTEKFFFDVIEIRGFGEKSMVTAYLNPARCSGEGTIEKRFEMLIKWINGYDLCE